MEKEYLGDSVYVEVEDGMAKITTENGGPPSNTIYMEQATVEAFINWYKRISQS